MARAALDIGNVMHDVTLHVTVRAVTRARMWLGIKVMMLGAAIIGCRSEIEIVE